MDNLTISAKKHLVPLLLIFLASFAYFYPTWSGKKLVQKDIIESLCMQGEMKKYRDKGEHILWTNNMFSGMPTFQIRHYSGTAFISNILFWLNEWIDNPGFYLFMGMLGIYIFTVLLGIDRWLALLAAAGYAWSTFNIIGIIAGHTSKALSMAFMAPVTAGVIYTFRKNILSGALLTAFFLAYQIRTNHMQITYYLFIILLLLMLFELIRHLRLHEVVRYIKASGMLSLAVSIALLSNATLLLTTYDYARYSMRGGASELSTKTEQRSKGGLTKEYAFSWSYGILESFTFLIPGFYGGATLDKLGENSHTYKTLINRGVASHQAQKAITQVPTYWGNQPYTAGPIYFGATVIFLMLFALLLVQDPLKWWMLASIVLAVLLAWGKNFPLLSYFFFDYVPFYNKFRTPSMMLSVVMFLAPVLSVWGVHEVINKTMERRHVLRAFKISAGATAGLCLAVWLAGNTFEYTATDPKIEIDKKYFENYKNVSKSEQFASEMLKALKADRKMILQHDALRSLLFISLSALVLYLYVVQKINVWWLISSMGLLLVADLWGINVRYLNRASYVDRVEYQKNFMPRPVDDPILKDSEIYFRVYDVTRDPFNSAASSYYLKTIGGYHAAKLQRYQDVIEAHLRKGNMNVINMLNTKYYISLNENKQPILQLFPDRLGNAWSVQNITYVNDADEELESLHSFNPKTTTVVDKRYATYIGDDTIFNSTGSLVQLISYHPEKLVYRFQADQPQFVVFSEIFYKGNEDWKSYIDGKEVPHIRVNYILRGMKVPAGQHEIMFVFKPRLFYLGEKITLTANILMTLLLAGYLVAWRVRRKPVNI